MSPRNAIVVGAGSGLGQATAIALDAARLRVVGVDRNQAGLKELPERIRQEVADVVDRPQRSAASRRDDVVLDSST